jgi:hypothetical protein
VVYDGCRAKTVTSRLQVLGRPINCHILLMSGTGVVKEEVKETII